MESHELHNFFCEALKQLTSNIQIPSSPSSFNLHSSPVLPNNFMTWSFLYPTPNFLPNPFHPIFPSNQCSVIQPNITMMTENTVQLANFMAPVSQNLQNRFVQVSTISGPNQCKRVKIQRPEPSRQELVSEEEDEYIDVVNTEEDVVLPICPRALTTERRGTKRLRVEPIFVREKPRDWKTEPPVALEYIQLFDNEDFAWNPQTHLYPKHFTQAMIYFLEDPYWRRHTDPIPHGTAIPPAPHGLRVRVPPVELNGVPPVPSQGNDSVLQSSRSSFQKNSR